MLPPSALNECEEGSSASQANFFRSTNIGLIIFFLIGKEKYIKQKEETPN